MPEVAHGAGNHFGESDEARGGEVSLEGSGRIPLFEDPDDQWIVDVNRKPVVDAARLVAAGRGHLRSSADGVVHLLGAKLWLVRR
jgi:hypothetical protein